MSTTPLEKAIEAAGGQTKLAKAVGKTQGHVSQWLIRGGKVPADLVLTVEQVTGVSRHELRPDIFGEAA